MSASSTEVVVGYMYMWTMNFIFFMIGCTGMVLSTLPWPDYAIGIGVLIAAADIAYAVLWMAFRKRLGDLAALDSTPSGRNAGRE